MDWDLDAAVGFVATHARVLDRRRLDGLLGDSGGGSGVVAALDAYRNADGGYGWGLEPDHRSSTSQPVAAMHALEVLADIGDVTTTRPIEICDWLAEHTLAHGGVPFILPFADTAGSAGHWTDADPSVSSVQMTSQLAAQAHRLGRRRPDVAAHPWVATATSYCLSAIADSALDPYELMFVLRFLDCAAANDKRAGQIVGRFSALVASDRPTSVSGGADSEALHLLDFTPYQDAPSREHFGQAAITRDLERLAAGQQADGGWTVDYQTFSAAAALEWRGYATVAAVAILLGIDR
jgi:hypothetical protein